MYADLVPLEYAGTDDAADATIDTASELDRIYFERYPHRQIYARRMLQDEWGVTVFDHDSDPLVIVINVEPGMRLRKPHIITAARARAALRMNEAKLRREWSRPSRDLLAYSPGLTPDGRLLRARKYVSEAA